jgi:hypothetical protein
MADVLDPGEARPIFKKGLVIDGSAPLDAGERLSIQFS